MSQQATAGKLTTRLSARRLLRSLFALPIVLLAIPASAQATEPGNCPNEAFRTGRSASLPDCRAYELVTPPELGRTEDMAFLSSNDQAVASANGEHVALKANGSLIEPGVSITGTQAVFSRTPTGWTMKSIAAPEETGDELVTDLFSPELSQTAFTARPVLNVLTANRALEVGPVGGPYTTLGSIPPQEGQSTRFLAANAGAGSVPAFNDVVFSSEDHALLPPGPERELAEQTEPEAGDVYEWAEGQLHLINVDSEGTLLNTCGAQVGGAEHGTEINAVSADGSRVFFLSPAAERPAPCVQPQLYMRVDGRETVNISEPEGVNVPLAARESVQYDGASPDGSKVFFTTVTALTQSAGPGPYLYEYDTEAPAGHRLTLIVSDIEEYSRINPIVVVAEDGSTVYYEQGGDIHRYDTATTTSTFVAGVSPTRSVYEPSYTTPNGEFLVFASGKEGGPGVMFADPHGGLVEETRGVGHTELYRYDAADGSVMCVSCGESVAPAKGEVHSATSFTDLWGTGDTLGDALEISEDGRRVFFQTNARLVPQDTNETSAEEETIHPGALGPGSDVYEWEENGTEEASGVFCGVANGCTHLISAGEDVGPESFLGASANGKNVFFTSAAQFVPQATLEFTNIYDARVDGGFPPPPPNVECSSCQGVGSPPPLFGVPASGSFEGAGNPALPSPPTQSPPPKVLTRAQKLSKALEACKKDKAKKKRSSCEAQARKSYGAKKAKKAKKASQGSR